MIFSKFNFVEGKPRYSQIEDHIKDMIAKGMLINGGKLPATRELAHILDVSRNTIMAAYDNLEIQGIVYTIKGKGTFVCKQALIEETTWNVNWRDRRNHYSQVAEQHDIVKTEIPWEKGLISFKSIAPDGSLFDLDEVKKAFLNRIALEGDKILNYGYAKGYKPLNEYLLNYMHAKGVQVEHKEIIMTNGFTEGLDLLLAAYTKPGDKIICENPTHHTAIKMMKGYGLEIIGIEMKEDGIDEVHLEKALIAEDIKFGYLIPSYHNPTGIVMDGEKRSKVYNLFKKHQVPIIEDGFNEELLYSSQHLAPLIALDHGGAGVVYISSFSKILFPGMRVGWVLADRQVISTLESVKRCKNIHTSFLDQAILCDYLQSGAFEKCVKRARQMYKEKYLFALTCIKRYIEPSFIWGEGGLYLYIGIEGVDSRILLKKCYEKKVIFMPGDIFATDAISCKNTLRLGFSRVSLEEIEEGIRIIGECLKK